MTQARTRRKIRKDDYSTIVFDLSEVLISGLVGVEQKLAPIVKRPEREILSAFGGDPLVALCRGELSEQDYLAGVLREHGWAVEVDELKKHVRANFHWKIADMKELVFELADTYDLVIHSDHAREWIEYILAVHPFLNMFREKVFSYEIGLTKDNPDAFLQALKRFGKVGDECLFVDDNLDNVDNAKACGMCGIPFSSARVLRLALEAHGIRVTSEE